MSYLIDSHCHLHDAEFFTPEQAEAMLLNARANDVRRIVCIGTDPDDSLAARDFAKAHSQVYWTYGVHPEEWEKWATADADAVAAAVKSLAREKLQRLVAIGEVGLDYHTEGYNRTAQIKLLEEMLQIATANNLPVSFHVRNAFDDFFGVVANFPDIRGVLHSFTDSKKTLKRLLEQTDFYVGVNGLSTYTTLPLPPLERILLETDAPFLAPDGYRGTTNEPSHIKDIAEWLSRTLDVPYATVQHATTHNAEELFSFA